MRLRGRCYAIGNRLVIHPRQHVGLDQRPQVPHVSMVQAESDRKGMDRLGASGPAAWDRRRRVSAMTSRSSRLLGRRGRTKAGRRAVAQLGDPTWSRPFWPLWPGPLPADQAPGDRPPLAAARGPRRGIEAGAQAAHLRGQLAYGAKHLVQAAGPALAGSNRIAGSFRRTQKGFGFALAVDSPSASAASRSKTSSSPRNGAATPPTATRLPCNWGGGSRASWARAAASWKSSSARRANSSAPTSSPAGRPTSPPRRHRSSRSRSAWAGEFPSRERTPAATTKWSSKWSVSPRPSKPGEGVITEVLGPQLRAGRRYAFDHPRI